MATTAAKDWISKKPKGTQEVKVPSGNICLVRVIDPEQMLMQGLIPNALLADVMKAAKEQAGVTSDVEGFTDEHAAVLMDKIINDPSELDQMMQMVNAICVNTVVEPTVLTVPLWSHQDVLDHRCTEEMQGKEIAVHIRPEVDGLWVDQVDMEDRMFLFQFAVGGGEEIAPFREGVAAVMAALPNGGAVQLEA